jgi:hypothetical protein
MVTLGVSIAYVILFLGNKMELGRLNTIKFVVLGTTGEIKNRIHIRCRSQRQCLFQQHPRH